MLTEVTTGLAVLLAGLSAALWVESPAAASPRTRLHADGKADEEAAVKASRWAARADAPALNRRVLVALLAAVATGFCVHRLGGVFELFGWLVVPVLALGGVLILGRLEPAAARRHRERLVLELPPALELLSACLAAGMPLRRATDAVAATFDGPVAEDLGQVLALVRLGASDGDAWRTLRHRVQWAAVAIDLARSVESGTMMVDVLVQHARAARDLRRAAMEVAAKSVGVRSVLPLMTCFLPAFMLLGIVPTVASAVSAALF